MSAPLPLGISLLDCVRQQIWTRLNEKIYRKITTLARESGVNRARSIAKEFGIPIVNKRISVTPIALVGGVRLQDVRRIL